MAAIKALLKNVNRGVSPPPPALQGEMPCLPKKKFSIVFLNFMRYRYLFLVLPFLFILGCSVEGPTQDAVHNSVEDPVVTQAGEPVLPQQQVGPEAVEDQVGLQEPVAEPPIEFSVVAYNVENLFDVDGVALFDDYKQDEAGGPFAYTRLKFLTKLENAVKVLDALEPGGSDVILFQELENDFTPRSSVEDISAFIEAHKNTTVRAMLTDSWRSVYAGYPSVAWLAKAMADVGMEGYQFAVAPEKDLDSGIAHVNAIFSRFPIVQVSHHEIPQARDITEAELDIGGHSVWVFNNHWKSGASSPEREPIRVENAKVLRTLVDARLEHSPLADIIIGGDLNSHYNHSVLYPDIETGINGVLGSQAIEGEGLYNLWYEIEPEARYSEVWRGRRGTLMHIIVSPGLYDREGVSYVDGSFRIGKLVGLNADAMERPLAWNFAGKKGGGASDHFPLVARFSTVPFEANGPLNVADDALDYERRHDADPSIIPSNLPDGRFLNDESVRDSGKLVGSLFSISAKVVSERPLRLEMDGKEWPAYAPAPHVRTLLVKEAELDLVVSYGYWKGKSQLVVEAVL
ncbi:MAG: endonuclease/exonuclease/phosphatase family protein [Opitutales bacterium]